MRLEHAPGRNEWCRRGLCCRNALRSFNMCFACDSWSVTVANPSPPQPSSSAGGLGWPSASSTFHICSLPSPPGLLGPVLRNAAVRVNLHSWLFTSNLAQLCRPHQQLCAQPCYYLDYTPPAHSSGLHLNERGEKEGERERETASNGSGLHRRTHSLFSSPSSLRGAYVRPTNPGRCVR